MPNKYYYEFEYDQYYCYPGSRVLKNKLNLQNDDDLENAEREIVYLRTLELAKAPIPGKFNFAHLKAIHKYLFGDIYEWAGKTRNVNISKGNQFCPFQNIESEMHRIEAELKKEKFLQGLGKQLLAKRLAYYIGEINAIHPFREGNGRAQREFIKELAAKNGYMIQYDTISELEMIEASADTFELKYQKMEELMLRALN